MFGPSYQFGFLSQFPGLCLFMFFFRWLEKGYRRFGYYTSGLLSFDLLALASASSIGVESRRQAIQKDLGPRIRRVREVRLMMLDSFISKYLQISCDL